MIIEIKQPKVDAPTERGQIYQLRQYLCQMVEDLTFALNDIEKRLNELEKGGDDGK